MRRTLILILGTTACATAGSTGGPTDVQTAAAFVEAQAALLKPLSIEANRTWFDASTSGSNEAWAANRAADDAYNRFLADPERFAQVQALRRTGAGDALVRRQLDVLYMDMLGKQVAPERLAEITALEKEVEQAFNTYRGEVGGKRVTQNEIETILKSSTDEAQLRAAWEAQKGVGALVAPKLMKLAGLRNQVAEQLGYRDFYAMRLAESEIDEKQLLEIFDELDLLTREPFLRAKAEVDARLAKRLGIQPGALMPWHYQNPFFQEPPDVFDTGLDAAFAKQDVVALSRRFFEGIGLDVAGIVARSDLYEKEGKSPHAFSTDIDREGDVRILCNIVPGFQWTQTTVHELGHAVYDAYIDRELPWLLRAAAHPLTTEGLAMMLDRAVGKPRWAEKLGVIDAKTRAAADAEARAFLAFAPLQFSRWTQVMLRFERELYRDPSQDLNTLWWDLVGEYQAIKRPPNRDAPDYASKIHLVVAPVYYHNYMLGDLFAAQVHEAIAAELRAPPADTVYVGEPAVGKFLKEKLFASGKLYPWHELTERITGKPLGAEAFARRFAE